MPWCFASDGGWFGNDVECSYRDAEYYFVLSERSEHVELFLYLSARAILDLPFFTHGFPYWSVRFWKVLLKVFSKVWVARQFCQRWLGVLVWDVGCCGPDGECDWVLSQRWEHVSPSVYGSGTMLELFFVIISQSDFGLAYVDVWVSSWLVRVLIGFADGFRGRCK